MTVEELKLHFAKNIIETDSNKQLLDYLKVHVYNNSNYFELSCSPDVCTCIESDKDFYTNHCASFYDLVENDSVIGKHCGFNIRRDNNKFHEIYVLDGFGKQIKRIVIIKQSSEDYQKETCEKQKTGYRFVTGPVHSCHWFLIPDSRTKEFKNDFEKVFLDLEGDAYYNADHFKSFHDKWDSYACKHPTRYVFDSKPEERI